MIALALLLMAQQGEPGVFEHGAWQGRCFRDGYMQGSPQELCRGVMTGTVEISFERTASGILFRIEAPKCAGMTLNVTPEPAGRPAVKRGAALAGMLELMARSMLKDCNSKYHAPKIDAAALGAVLVETDGLEPVK